MDVEPWSWGTRGRILNGMPDIAHEKPEEDTKKTATVFLMPATTFLEGPAVRGLWLSS